MILIICIVYSTCPPDWYHTTIVLWLTSFSAQVCICRIWRKFGILLPKLFWPTVRKNCSKGHSFCEQCLHDLQFMKTRSSSQNLSKLARADISCQFMKTRSLCRHCSQMDFNSSLIWNLGHHPSSLLLSIKMWSSQSPTGYQKRTGHT